MLDEISKIYLFLSKYFKKSCKKCLQAKHLVYNIYRKLRKR